MRLPTVAIALLSFSAVGIACSGGDAGDSSSSQQNSGGWTSSSSSGSSSASGLEDILSGGGSMPSTGAFPTGGTDTTGPGASCATQSASASLQPVYLAFAFDVSGSMGAGTQPWFDKELKWDPVVAATKAFFEDPASEGLTASLTFFPDDRRACSVNGYTSPDVPMTPLPSDLFSRAIDDITPESGDEWIDLYSSTPTRFVTEGTVTFIRGHRANNPGKYVLVLVTDGYPQNCDRRSDRIEAVVEVVEDALGDGIATYVIGVANPPVRGAPDSVSNLHQIAEAGGSGQAFIIDTGDPDATAASFRAAIDQIRGASLSCTMGIPDPPDGRKFDKSKVRVTYTSGGGAPTAIDYDQECASDSGWRYDDPADPRQIVLCPGTCATIEADPNAALAVDFTCESVIQVPH